MKKNDVWFVTGASKGIGLILVKQLLARGYRVAATSRSLGELTRALEAKSERFLPLELELGDETATLRSIQATQAHFGSLQVVVNNAGYGQFGTVEETSDEEARRNFDVNVFGTLNVLRAALPVLREQRSGHVFNVSSIAGYVGGFSGWGIYCATKFALSGLTEALHADLLPLGVKVTLVYPGYFRTSFLSEASLMEPKKPIAAYEAARASRKQHGQVIDGNQPGDPQKLADALIDVYERDNPPLHLFLGADAVSLAEAKQARIEQAIAEQRTISVATDF
ncbi:MAG TPA: SDR family NAD(P)-dependent oxidoreductase [Polyangiaceae bacterium]|nr:SDR family NAD(P)-dependent oxidoreductase [Polyangiaceae bacterium]